MSSRPDDTLTHPRYSIFRAWEFELVTILLALGLVVAITVLLATHEGLPAPDWGEHLNLNALLALLSTILRAALVVIVAQIISQRKWEWLSESPHPLSTLQIYDSGSRGSLGALSLIKTVLLKDITALLAASVLLVSFLIGPAVQQASRTAECSFPAPGLNASVPYGHYIPRRGGYDQSSFDSASGTPTPDIIAAILSAATNPMGVEHRISPSCSTGNCTFPSMGNNNESTDFQAVNTDTSHSTVAMCSVCTDVTSLVSPQNVSEGSGEYTSPMLYNVLPNGVNVSAEYSKGYVMKLYPTANLSWMGELLSPEVRLKSRWAYSNVTMLATGSSCFSGEYRNDNCTVAAAVCSVYPCMRTYNVSVTNNELSEEMIRSEVMQPNAEIWSMEPEDGLVGQNMNVSYHRSSYYNYVAVRSPCPEPKTLQDIPRDSRTLPTGKEMSLYDFTDYGGPGPYQFSHRNVTAPESCTYTHDATLAHIISTTFNQEIFSGVCDSYKSLMCVKYRDGDFPGGGVFEQLAVGTIMRILYNNGRPSFENTTRWFDSFADAMTNKFRSEYGTAAKNGTFSDYSSSGGLHSIGEFPLELVQGIAWQSKTCVAMNWKWLLLPIILTSVTIALSAWMCFTNWRHRYMKPVWKDSIMPLIFYNDRLQPDDLEGHVRKELMFKTKSTRRDSPEEGDERLMEAREMVKRGSGMVVQFRWPRFVEQGTEDRISSSTGTPQKDKGSLRSRSNSPSAEGAAQQSENTTLISTEEPGYEDTGSPHDRRD
ncbi:uncharacterized protein EKO05_0009397 [Ascochyta rabiei]|uniref:uncharacterized protein n=1 Tax=Didymella rabiei TaxID=5454 RepID=UPI00220E0569|nr:uncharacterized protein EKO05_0009397 [Ascochyta rabiei]UPX19125.1 hypothetical protein EKO05_0009397 [Ascochyta rabiei]